MAGVSEWTTVIPAFRKVFIQTGRLDCIFGVERGILCLHVTNDGRDVVTIAS